jgi:hypothetical protein
MTDAGRKISGRNIFKEIFLPLIFLPAKDQVSARNLI